MTFYTGKETIWSFKLYCPVKLHLKLCKYQFTLKQIVIVLYLFGLIYPALSLHCQRGCESFCVEFATILRFIHNNFGERYYSMQTTEQRSTCYPTNEMKFKYMTPPHLDTIFQENRRIWILVDRLKRYS